MRVLLLAGLVVGSLVGAVGGWAFAAAHENTIVVMHNLWQYRAPATNALCKYRARVDRESGPASPATLTCGPPGVPHTAVYVDITAKRVSVYRVTGTTLVSLYAARR